MTAARAAARVWAGRPAAVPLRAAHHPFAPRVTDVLDTLEHRVTYRQIDYWLRRFGALLLERPAATGPAVRRHERTFTDVEFARLVRMGQLVLAGRQPAAAAREAAQPPPRDLALAWATDRGECT